MNFQQRTSERYLWINAAQTNCFLHPLYASSMCKYIKNTHVHTSSWHGLNALTGTRVDGSSFITEKHHLPWIKVYEPSVVMTPLQSGFGLIHFLYLHCPALLRLLGTGLKGCSCLSAHCFCVCVWTCESLHTHAPGRGTQRAWGPLELSYSCLCAAAGMPNLGPLQEHCVLLTTETSL